MKLFEQMIKYLKSYNITPALKTRALKAFLIQLQRDERHYEANEVSEIIDGIEPDSEHSINEYIFTADYYF